MIKRNLQGKCEEDVRRTIEDLSAQIDVLKRETIVLRESAGRSFAQLTQRTSDIAGLVGARAQAVIGPETPDPVLAQFGGGTVTAVTAGDLSPLFTTTESAAPIPNITFLQVVQNANLMFAGPATGAAANPTFRALVNADLPSQAWTSFTPTFTNLNVGATGTVTGRWAQIGKIVIGRWEATLGGAGLAVSGDVDFTLPATSVSYAGVGATNRIGSGNGYDAGVALYPMVVKWLSTTKALVRAIDTSGAYGIEAALGAAIPFAWGAADELSCSFCYECA